MGVAVSKCGPVAFGSGGIWVNRLEEIRMSLWGCLRLYAGKCLERLK